MPLKTTVRTQVFGECKTFHRLEVEIEGPDKEAGRLPVSQPGEVVFRTKDGGPLASVTWRDAYANTRLAVFPGSCRTSMTIAWNEPDVRSVADAQRLLDERVAAAGAACALRDALADVVSLASAFRLLDGMVASLYSELTDTDLLQLRETTKAGADALGRALLSCSSPLTQTDRLHLLRLYATLAAFGDGSNPFRSPDGAPRTLADVLGPENAASLERAREVVAQRSTGRDTSTAEYESAASACAAAQSTVSLARTQLRAWLSDGGTEVGR